MVGSKKLCVIGSLNMDLVATVQQFPKPGETITGKAFGTYPGGKGANQAVAAARLGANTRMVGKVGNDMYGDQYIDTLKQEGIKYDTVGIEPDTSSGIAIIEVDSIGENHIVIIPGANDKVDRDFIDSKWDNIVQGDIFLFQLEIPLDTVIYSIKKLKEAGKTIILDPAPARDLPHEIYPYLDYITPNETETEFLTKRKIHSQEDLKSAVDVLLDKGIGTVIAKAGRNGAFIISKEKFIHVPGFTVDVMDTTAAGDSFNAGFAYAFSRGKDLEDCVKMANGVAALSTTAKGAQEAMPTLDQVEAFIKKQG
ncbi:MAG TPA: ribokinase [Clostridia bacterium]|nr:ribokinase [Clostridia bacterium]